MGADMDYNSFLQDEPRYNEKEAWPAELFPEAQYRYFHEVGCLVCSIAFMLRYHGIVKESDRDSFNPLTLCEELIRINGFFSNADMEIAAISRLYPVGYLGAIDYSEEAFRESIEKGYLCLLVVKGKQGPVHFVAAQEITADDVAVFDPKAGRRYLSEYPDIYQIRLFYKTDHLKEGNDYILRYPSHYSDDVITDKVAFGFDDGPAGSNTERVLDVLEANDIKATFFLLGKKIGEKEYNVQRMAQDGHQIGIHGWDHLYLDAMSEEDRRDNLKRTSDEIRRVCNVNPTIMRPPGGYADDRVLKTVKELGLAAIGWSVDSEDYKYAKTVEAVAETVLKQVSAGDIILMHDNIGITPDALQIIIPELKRRGLHPVTIEELISDRGGIVPGRVYNWI